MKNFIVVCCVIFMAAVSGCSSQNNDNKNSNESAEKQQVVAKESSSDVLLTQEGMEKKLASLGISVYPGAELEKVDLGYGSGCHRIVYNIPDSTEESRNVVDEYYKPIFDKLESSGWKKVVDQTGSYRKDSNQITFSHPFNMQLGIHNIVLVFYNNMAF